MAQSHQVVTHSISCIYFLFPLSLSLFVTYTHCVMFQIKRRNWVQEVCYLYISLLKPLFSLVLLNAVLTGIKNSGVFFVRLKKWNIYYFNYWMEIFTWIFLIIHLIFSLVKYVYFFFRVSFFIYFIFLFLLSTVTIWETLCYTTQLYQLRSLAEKAVTKNEVLTEQICT